MSCVHRDAARGLRDKLAASEQASWLGLTRTSYAKTPVDFTFEPLKSHIGLKFGNLSKYKQSV